MKKQFLISTAVMLLTASTATAEQIRFTLTGTVTTDMAWNDIWLADPYVAGDPLLATVTFDTAQCGAAPGLSCVSSWMDFPIIAATISVGEAGVKYYGEFVSTDFAAEYPHRVSFQEPTSGTHDILDIQFGLSTPQGLQNWSFYLSDVHTGADAFDLADPNFWDVVLGDFANARDWHEERVGEAADFTALSITAQPTAAVPDPGSTLLLFGMGLVAVRACRRGWH